MTKTGLFLTASAVIVAVGGGLMGVGLAPAIKFNPASSLGKSISFPVNATVSAMKAAYEEPTVISEERVQIVNRRHKTDKGYTGMLSDGEAGGDVADYQIAVEDKNTSRHAMVRM